MTNIQKRVIPASELVLNKDGSIYHLHLHPEQIADIIFLVGDPGRVPRVSRHFDQIDEQVSFREFCTHTGRIGSKRLSVISTGIGTDNIDIVLNELDALRSIDLKSREVKQKVKPLKLIRIGTSGTFREEVNVGSMVASSGGLGLDALMHFYPYNMNSQNEDFLKKFKLHMGEDFRIQPYYFDASSDLLQHFEQDFEVGITVTCAGFYGPQGRHLRSPIRYPNLLEKLSSFDSPKQKLTNFEMETSGIYGMSAILGHHALSCNAILANRAKGEFASDPAQVVNQLIESVLEKVVSVDL